MPKPRTSLDPPLHWLTFRPQDETVVAIISAHSPIAARLKAGLLGMPAEHFAESHQLDIATANKVPADMIGRALTRKEAERLLKALA